MVEQAIPTPPRYNLKRVFQMRDKLSNDKLTEFLGFSPSGGHFDDLVNAVSDEFPRVRHRVIRDSMEYLAGTLLTEVELKRLAWRLAGNITRLRDGIPVLPWHAQHELEWMPAQILSWQHEHTPGRKPGSRYTMRVLAGTACPMKLTTFMSRGLCHMIARRAGFTSLRHAYPFDHQSALVNCRLWALVDPERCYEGRPGFQEFGCSPGLIKWNKDILKMRNRKGGFSCPYGYEHRCFKCAVGYLECPAATHRETIEEA